MRGVKVRDHRGVLRRIVRRQSDPGILREHPPAPAQPLALLGDRYRRLSHRRGKKRAIVAVGNSVLTIVWHLLSDPTVGFQDLGPGYHESRITSRRRQRDLIRQLEHLTSQRVTLQPAA
jgi:hypothetical protein